MKSVAHPRSQKYCVFCKYWIGDAHLVFKSSLSGYEYERGVHGKCTKSNSTRDSHSSCIQYYAPNLEAERLL